MYLRGKRSEIEPAAMLETTAPTRPNAPDQRRSLGRVLRVQDVVEEIKDERVQQAKPERDPCARDKHEREVVPVPHPRVRAFRDAFGLGHAEERKREDDDEAAVVRKTTAGDTKAPIVNPASVPMSTPTPRTPDAEPHDPWGTISGSIAEYAANEMLKPSIDMVSSALSSNVVRDAGNSTSAATSRTMPANTSEPLMSGMPRRRNASDAAPDSGSTIIGTTDTILVMIASACT